MDQFINVLLTIDRNQQKPITSAVMYQEWFLPIIHIDTDTF